MLKISSSATGGGALTTSNINTNNYQNILADELNCQLPKSHSRHQSQNKKLQRIYDKSS